MAPELCDGSAVRHHHVFTTKQNERSSIDAVIACYKRDIDRTLLRENLRRTPEERLQVLIALQQLDEELKRAGRRLRMGKP